MRNMVAQVRHSGAEGMTYPKRSRSQVARLLKDGWSIDQVAYLCHATRREVRRIARKEGLE